MIGVDAATLWRWRKAGIFPAPVKITRQTLRWREADLLAWLESRRAGKGASA
jgi:prophage regulatory protein